MTLQHIPVEQLTDFASNTKDHKAAARIQSHLATCSECASKLASIKKNQLDSCLESNPVAGDAGYSPDIEAPASNRLVAVLSFDSRQLSSAFGVRAGRSVARQLLFSIGENDLDLRVAPDDGAWIVSGQVLGECNSGTVELRGGNIIERASMNELCEFYLPRVPPGSYSLLVQISNMEIEVPEFELRA